MNMCSGVLQAALTNTAPSPIPPFPLLRCSTGPGRPDRALLAEGARRQQAAASSGRFADDVVPEPVLASWRPQATRGDDQLTTSAGGTELGGYGYGGYGYGSYGGGYGGSDNTTTATPPANTVPYTFHIRFVGMDCGALLGDAAKLIAFKAHVRSAVAKAAGLDDANARVSNVTCGSVVSWGRPTWYACLQSADHWGLAFSLLKFRGLAGPAPGCKKQRKNGKAFNHHPPRCAGF
jgi:hypothetical protein